MSFNSALFLFLFLPAFLIIYLVARLRWRRWIGLAASIVFYAWGQVYYLPLMTGLIAMNYYVGRRIGSLRESAPMQARRLLALGVAANACLLLFFKLLAAFGLGMFGGLAAALPESAAGWLASLVFPLGLSYVSFQVISYLIDAASGTIEPEQDFQNFALYVLLFPKLLVGPITRYKSLAQRLARPSAPRELVASGIRRFIEGLAKKVLIADTLATVVNAVFDQPAPMVMPHIAWLALIAYALQIYYDFSGFTDMAIGLGEMMGFRFVENFNYPYVAQGIGDFWRRWHISLSSWFRDYVFFPLERRRARYGGQVLNLLIVFLLTGLWHGVTVTFVLWGLLHGLFMVLESAILSRWLQKTIRPIRHAYALTAILLTWLIFRSPSPAFAWGYLGRLAGNADGILPLPFTQTAPLPFIEPSFWLALSIGALFAMPVKPYLGGLLERIYERVATARLPFMAAYDLLLLFLFVLSIAAMTSSKFIPGIYGRF